jgi:hypothetical protein
LKFFKYWSKCCVSWIDNAITVFGALTTRTRMLSCTSTIH